MSYLLLHIFYIPFFSVLWCVNLTSSYENCNEVAESKVLFVLSTALSPPQTWCASMTDSFFYAACIQEVPG